ncbi:MAG: SDR family oxidoreductase [Erysipelotrichaceae bacterium]
MNKQFKDKVVVVTGGSGVLLYPVCQSLCQRGAKVAILSISEKEVKEAEARLLEQGYQALGLVSNVLEKKSLKAAKEIINDKFGSIDILINGAGGNHPKGTSDQEQFNISGLQDDNIKTFFDLDEEGFKFVMDLNFIGTLLPTQIFAIDMVEKEDAAILNISSMNAYTPLTKIPAYSGAKAAISNFTQWLAVHFATTNIRVNAIAPGFFVTTQNELLLKKPDGSLTERSQKILRNTPMNRFGEKEEIIEACLFLLDNDKSSFITGVVLPIDGGFSAYSGV